MSFKTITISRKELYEQVWSTPILQLAKHYHLSDNGLRKICQRHEISTPPIGYWARRQHGHKDKKPLLRGDPDRTIEITFKLAPIIEKNKNQKLHSDLSEVRKIIVPDKLINPHPLVSQTKASFINPV